MDRCGYLNRTAKSGQDGHRRRNGARCCSEAYSGNDVGNAVARHRAGTQQSKYSCAAWGRVGSNVIDARDEATGHRRAVRGRDVGQIEAPGTLRGGYVGIESRQVPVPVSGASTTLTSTPSARAISRRSCRPGWPKEPMRSRRLRRSAVRAATTISRGRSYSSLRKLRVTSAVGRLQLMAAVPP